MTFGPALGLWGLEAVVGLVAGGRVRHGVHLAVLGSLATMATVHVVEETNSLRGPGLVAAAVAVGAGFAVVFSRVGAVRSGVRFASAAPIAFLVLFLVASPVADLLRPGQVEAASGVEIGRPAPVIMLVLDELPLDSLIGRDGGIAAERYPGFAELAEAGHWYRNATAVSPSTWHAVPALLTGRYPHDAAPVAADHPDNLFTLLARPYDLDVTESITRLCPDALCRSRRVGALESLRGLGSDARSVLGDQLSPEDPAADPVAGLVEQPAPTDENGFLDLERNQPERFRSFLDGIGPSDGPSLDYLHIVLPHVPWRYLPSGRQYPYPAVDPGKVDQDFWSDEPWPAQLGRERHLLQVQYVDSLVQALLDRLHETGVFDDALVVVTADHGVAFQPGEPVRGLQVEHFAEAVHPEMMWVPLFVKTPHQRRGERSDANVETVDVLPTMADALGIDLPWRVDGMSALGPGRPDDEPKSFFQSQVGAFGVTPGERAAVDAGASWPLVLQRALPDVLRGDGPLAPYRVGPRPELVGRDVGAVGAGPPSPVTAVVDDAGRLAEVDLRSGRVPALVTGHLEGARRGEVAALSVDGTIAAVVPTFSGDGQVAKFAALVPEPLLQDGDNHLRVDVLGPDGRLRPTTAP